MYMLKPYNDDDDEETKELRKYVFAVLSGLGIALILALLWIYLAVNY